MKRAVLSLVAGVVVLFSVLGLGAPAFAGTDDFEFESFSADYYLAVDEAGRSTLTTVETFVALFPDIDQNRGIRRAIPESYQDAPTDVSVLSVTDENGTPRAFETETSDDGFLLVTSRADDFVYGRQTYVFTYTQRNVTRFFADSNDDEFYWDTNGTGWAQQFGSVSARVHVPAALTGSLNGRSGCYRGAEGSTDSCELSIDESAVETVFSTTVAQVAPYENVTVAIGFEPQTFVARDDSYFGSPFSFLQLLSLLGSLGALIWAVVVRRTSLSDGRGRPTIIAEYTPPKNVDVITASVLLGKTTRAAASQFVDFAVRHKIRIVETEKQGLFASGSTYLLELVDPTGLTPSEDELAKALFGDDLLPGATYLMKDQDVTLSQRVRAIIAAATSAATASGLRKSGAARHSILPVLLAIAAAVGCFVFGVVMLDNSVGGGVPFFLFIPPIIVVVIVFVLLFRVPLTDEGAELRDHLEGLELYIRLAEADRLQMLQSPTGAEREAVSAADPRQVLDIYEKLLPYAVLFSLEKQWAKELGKYYTDSSPDWYSGTGAFNAAVFASSISSLSTAAATSYSGSSSSSSSGGSGGGGSSGGGGGGGGGGGV